MKLLKSDQTGSMEKKKLKRWQGWLLSLFLPFFVMLLGLLALHIMPFGNHSLAISDGKYYINSFVYLSRLLKGQENLLYSLGIGLGANNWSYMAWGGYSIGGLLSVFGTLESMPFVFTWICVANMSLCGFTMYCLLVEVRGDRASNLIFSTSYALIGFNVVNCYHAVFSLGPQMLPLVVLGLIRLLRGKSPLTYIVSLAFCIIFNFYFGFMLCVASVLFFFALLYVHGDELKESKRALFLRYGLSSLLAGLLGAFVWLPTLKAYSGGGRLDQTGLEEYSFSENMPFIHIFSKLFSGANSTSEIVNGLPNIFCGILVVALVILFFMNKKISLRRRKAAGVLVAFYLLTFYIRAFTLAMHGFTHTNWFPYRYSFVFSFILIFLAYEEFEYIDSVSLKDTKRCGLYLLISVLLIFSVSYEFIGGGSVLLDLALLFVMWLGFYLNRTKPQKAPKKIFVFLLLILVCGNLYANFIISIKGMSEWELDLEQYNASVLESGAMVEAIQTVDPSFYRMEKDYSESLSVGVDPLLYNYNGVSASGPTIRMFVHKKLNQLGINWFDMRHWYSAGVAAATDSLLGLKYIVAENDLREEKSYDRLVGGDHTGIYQNPMALSVAILADKVCADVELRNNAFENLNTIWKTMTSGTEDIFVPATDITFTLHNSIEGWTVTSEELAISNSNSENGIVDDTPVNAYIEFSFEATQDGPIYRFDTGVPQSEDGKTSPSMVFIGMYKKGDHVTGRCESNANYVDNATFKGYCNGLAIAYADNAVLAEYAALLNSRDITFDVVHENDLTGSFTADADQRILFTIPWDEGWTCYIDGQPVPIDKTWDLFMSVEAPEGQHTYEMKFFPAWLNYGLMISGIALLGLVVFMITWHIRKKKSAAALPLPEETEAVA